jgi:hypothetical protein
MHKLAVQAQLEAVLQTLSKDKQTQAKRNGRFMGKK